MELVLKLVSSALTFAVIAVILHLVRKLFSKKK